MSIHYGLVWLHILFLQVKDVTLVLKYLQQARTNVYDKIYKVRAVQSWIIANAMNNKIQSTLECYFAIDVDLQTNELHDPH